MVENGSCWGTESVSATCPWYLEAEDDGPDEAEDEAMVAIHNVMGAHVLQVHLLLLQELQCLVHVLQAVDAHPALGGLGLGHDSTQCPALTAWHALPCPGTPHCHAQQSWYSTRGGLAWHAMAQDGTG